MNDFVASRVDWTIAMSSRVSGLAASGSRGDQPVDDLGLEDDVGQALGGPVVHRPGDVAAEILLGREDHPGHRGRHPRSRLATCRAGTTVGEVIAAGFADAGLSRDQGTEPPSGNIRSWLANPAIPSR